MAVSPTDQPDALLHEGAQASAPSRIQDLPLVVVDRRGPPPVLRRRGHFAFEALRLAVAATLLMGLGGLLGISTIPSGFKQFAAALEGSSRAAVPPRDFGPDRRLSEDAGAPTVPGAGSAPGRRFVAGLGRIRPESDVVTIAAPFGSGDARIAQLLVKEGDRVDEGALLAILDNERQLKAAVGSARAALDARRAMLLQSQATTHAAREEARAALARAESSAQAAVREFERIEELHRRGFAAEQTVDQRRTARDEARREVERLTATLSRFGTGDIDRQADVIVAAHQVAAAEADLARAEADLEKAYVRAPFAGTVLSIANRPGERPAATGMMNLGSLDRMQVEVEIYQTQIGRIALGQRVEITAEALPAPLKGAVTRIGLEVGRQGLVDASPAANTDARVVKVTVSLDDGSTPIAARFTNLQVTARVMTGGAS